MSGMIDLALAQLQPAIENDRLEFMRMVMRSARHSGGGYAGAWPRSSRAIAEFGGQQLLNLINGNTSRDFPSKSGWHSSRHSAPWQWQPPALPGRWKSCLWLSFPFPGVGVVSMDGDGFRFLPVGF
jgi:hypothetical protein